MQQGCGEGVSIDGLFGAEYDALKIRERTESVDCKDHNLRAAPSALVGRGLGHRPRACSRPRKLVEINDSGQSVSFPVLLQRQLHF